jgi:hypothetical protein
MVKGLTRRGAFDGRTKAAVSGKPHSPEQIDQFYDRVPGWAGRHRPDMDQKAEKPSPADKHQANQDPQDFHAAPYRNDVPLTGHRAWLRGGGKQGAGHLDFDHVGNPKGPKGPRNKATGQDISESPFSGAYRKGAGEGF